MLCRPEEGAFLYGRMDTTCHIGEEFIREIHCHAIGAGVYNLVHQGVIRHTPGTDYQALSMQMLDEPWGHQRGVRTELGTSQGMRLCDHGVAALPYQPARSQRRSVGLHRLQMCVLERGKSDMLRHTMGAHKV